MTAAASNQNLDKGNTNIHTIGMKIAISIPDSVFRAVKKAAEEQKRSRSEVIVEAVRAYLEKLESIRILQALDEAYASPDTEDEKNARRAAAEIYARTVLEDEKW